MHSKIRYNKKSVKRIFSLNFCSSNENIMYACMSKIRSSCCTTEV